MSVTIFVNTLKYAPKRSTGTPTGCLRKVWIGIAAAMMISNAQAQDPIAGRIVPKSFGPPERETHRNILDIGEFAGTEAPPGAEALSFEAAGVTFTGDAPPFADALAPTIKALAPGRRHPVTVAELFFRAHVLERSFADRGYVLYRVLIPPQQIIPGQPVIFQIVSGRIDSIDTTALSPAIQGAVRARLKRLLNLTPVHRKDLERALLLAGDFGGLALRSTFAPGETPGGVRLIVDGRFDRVNGAISAGRFASEAVGGWGVNASASLNSPFGRGEQFYAAYQGDPETSLTLDARMRIAAMGAIVPLGTDGLVLSPEILWSRLLPLPEDGVPDNDNQMARATLRMSYPWIRTPRTTLVASGTIEAITQSVTATEFDEALSSDTYLVFRATMQADLAAAPGLRLTGSFGLSQGLGDLAPVFTKTDDPQPSRQGADGRFTKISMTSATHANWPVLSAALSLKGQTSLGAPLYNSEQLSLDGNDALSGLSPGSYAVDEGLIARVEFSPTGRPKLPFTRAVTPYVFGALGGGWLNGATETEDPVLAAAGLGVGVHLQIEPGAGIGNPVTLNLEAGHSWLSTGEANPTRVNVSLGWTF